MAKDKIRGRNPVLEALKSSRGIDRIYILKGPKRGPINEIIKRAKENRISLEYVDRPTLDEIGQGKEHQGVVAMVAPYEYKGLEDLFTLAEQRQEDPFFIILDEIMDPHNLGSILRTADAVGAHGIIIPKRRSVGLTPAVAKTSAGAIEYVPVARVGNIRQTIERLKERGLWITGADMEGDRPYYQADMLGPIGLVLGNEGKGISRLVKEKCDFLVKVPMLGQIESLNVSVAAAILMYEVLRGRNL